MSKKKTVYSWGSAISARLEGLSEEQLRWVYLICRMLEAADAPTLQQTYYLLLGFLGAPVSEPDTTN